MICKQSAQTWIATKYPGQSMEVGINQPAALGYGASTSGTAGHVAIAPVQSWTPRGQGMILARSNHCINIVTEQVLKTSFKSTKFAVDRSDKKVQYDPDYIHFSIAYSSLLVAKVCIFTTSNPKSPLKNQGITVINQKFTSTRSHLIRLCGVSRFYSWNWSKIHPFSHKQTRTFPGPRRCARRSSTKFRRSKLGPWRIDEICKNSLP